MKHYAKNLKRKIKDTLRRHCKGRIHIQIHSQAYLITKYVNNFVKTTLKHD